MNVKDMISEIKTLPRDQQTEIVKIVINNNNKCSQNTTGVFINFKTLNEDTIGKIENFLNHCRESVFYLKKQEKNIEETKKKIYGDDEHKHSNTTDTDTNTDIDNSDKIDDEKTITEINPHYDFKRTFESWDHDTNIPDYVKRCCTSSTETDGSMSSKITYSKFHNDIIKQYQDDK
jgi:hypothetical protein